MTDTDTTNREDQATGPTPLARRLVELVVSPSSVTTVLAVLVALVIGGLLVAVADEDTASALGYFTSRPGDALSAGWSAVSSAYLALFQGSLGSVGSVSETLVAATPLILAGLAVAVPFRAGLFNIGGEGQIIAGGTAAGFIGFALTGVPLVIHLPLALLTGLLAGAAMGSIPGVLKARTGAHEVITTIMLNNIAAPLLLALLVTSAFQQPGRTDPISRPILDSATLPTPAASAIRVDAGILLAVLAAAVVWWVMDRSTLGFQIKAVGANATAAITAGMSSARTTVVTMAMAGGLAGLAGSGLVLGASGLGAVTGTFSSGYGFDGITVALLGRGKAGGTVAAGLVFGALRAGGLRMQARTGTPIDLIVVIQALVILFIAAPLVIQQLFRIRRGAGVGQTVAKGWGS
jgi:simple sugar transport system permease protein